jgi:hypothetical protein
VQFYFLARILQVGTTEKSDHATKMFPLWRDEERSDEAIPHFAELPRPDELAMTKAK